MYLLWATTFVKSPTFFTLLGKLPREIIKVLSRVHKKTVCVHIFLLLKICWKKCFLFLASIVISSFWTLDAQPGGRLQFSSVQKVYVSHHPPLGLTSELSSLYIRCLLEWGNSLGWVDFYFMHLHVICSSPRYNLEKLKIK